MGLALQLLGLIVVIASLVINVLSIARGTKNAVGVVLLLIGIGLIGLGRRLK